VKSSLATGAALEIVAAVKSAAEMRTEVAGREFIMDGIA
jgi:hypothetical protein